VDQPLLKTKLAIPIRRPDLILRPRLMRRLDKVVECKLALVSAPAGFGKTTLVSMWAEGSSLPVAWLTLDDQDNDPILLLKYLSAAVGSVKPELGETLSRLIETSRRPAMDVLLTQWINALEVSDERLVLVLDDFHILRDPAIHHIFEYLLDHLPAKLHLVIATRVDPPLPVSRLRAEGALIELRAADLRFSEQEAEAFLHECMRIQLDQDDVTLLNARTEGWIAGLQMAAVSMRAREDVPSFLQAFMGSDRYILDYLVEEVLQRQPEYVQTFLLRTSILDRLCGPLCDALLTVGEPGAISDVDNDAVQTGSTYHSSSSQATLEYLDRGNLFIVPLDNQRQWYRYHNLFADLLRHRLTQAEADLIPGLHSRVARWFEAQGMTAKAIEHALAAGDDGWAADLVESAVEATMLRSEFATLLRWVGDLPESQVLSRPRLGVYQALAMLLSGESLEVAESRLDEAVDADQHGAFLGEKSAFHALIAAYRGEYEKSADLSEHALDLLPEDRLFIRSFISGFLGFAQLFAGNVQTAMRAFNEAIRVSEKIGDLNISVLARHHLADLHALSGHADEAMNIYKQAYQLALDDEGRPRPIAGIALIGLGRLAMERDDLEAAEENLTRGIELIYKWGEAGAVSGYTGLARLMQARGDFQTALDHSRTALEIAERFDAMDVDDYSVKVCQARIWIPLGDFEAVERWAAERSLQANLKVEALREEIRTTSSLYRIMEYAAFAWSCIAQHRPDDALSVLEPMLEVSEDSGWKVYSIEILGLMALANKALKRDAQAIEALGRALSYAEQGGYVHLFVEKGPPMAVLLYQAAERGIHPEFVGKLLAAFPQADKVDESSKGHQAIVEPLSDREQEVLLLIAEGLSNQEIAQRLVLSVNTVKSHTYNIYGKLGVHSRTQSVAQARMLGILPEGS
jgi:LuxR family maltose regulon positive regulatory protein